MSTESDHNTILANERTYAAWVRTGLTALATGLGIARFLDTVISDPIIRTICMSLLLFSMLAFILGAWRYVYVGSMVAAHKEAGTPIPIILFLSALLVIVVILAMIGAWLM